MAETEERPGEAPSPTDGSKDVAMAEPVVSGPPVKGAPAAPAPSRSSWADRKRLIGIALVAAVSIVVVVLAVVLTRDETPPPEEPGFAYSTGVSLVTSYAVEATVRARLARTRITMEVDNALDCSSIHAVSLQLPLGTRIASLRTVSDDGCAAAGDVRELEEAREAFMESASAGIPAAYFEARDSFTHSLQVAIPPLGSSRVELVLEQLLKQRLGEVKFQLPLIPNEAVDSLSFNLEVFGTAGERVDFEADLDVPGVYSDEPSVDGNSTDEASITGPKHIKIDVPDARQHDLPKVVSGKFNPGELPENGLLYTDGRCFEHFFRPASLDPMPRNFVFLLDASSSMGQDSKLASAKSALGAFIDSLAPEDTFTIQAYGRRGTRRLWGSGPGTPAEKQDARRFVDSISAERGWGTDLHEALLEGLLRAKHAADVSDGDAATILVAISGEWASRGETNRTRIVEHVHELNREGTVSVFALGFQGSADTGLLDAIALTNGGVSAPVAGRDGPAGQISDFLESELGSVLMSDVSVDYFAGPRRSGESEVFGETRTAFPIMADGHEVVVRGLMGGKDGAAGLSASASATTMNGVEEWQASAAPSIERDEGRSALCFQSYAHERITQLLRLHDASDFLGDGLLGELVTLADEDCEEDTFAKCIRSEALALAIEANVVAEGLTAMVTVDNEKCMKLDDDAEICLDGTTPDGRPVRGYNDDDAYYVYDENMPAESAEGLEYAASAPASLASDKGYYYPESARSASSAHNKGAIPLFVLLCAWLFPFVLIL